MVAVETRTDEVIKFENYLKSLPSDNRKLVKNIFTDDDGNGIDIDGLMNLDQGKFKSLLQSSMSVTQLSELSDEDLDYRGQLTDEIFRQWCFAKVTLIGNGNGNDRGKDKKRRSSYHHHHKESDLEKEPELPAETTFKFSDNGKRCWLKL
jgi:hypothetical protein